MFRRAILILLLLASQSLAANKYVRSTDGNNADDGSTWALAKATLAGAFTAASAGDTIYVSDNHAENAGAAAITLTSPGTAASPCRVLCGDDSAEPPTALATTATITNTGTNSITFAGFAYYYGIAFNAGSGAGLSTITFSDAASSHFVLDTCSLALNSSNASSKITGPNTGNQKDAGVLLKNCTINFSNAVNAIAMSGVRFTMRGGSIAGTAPTILVDGGAFTPRKRCDFVGVDLSLCAGGSSLVNGAETGGGSYFFRDCKLGSSVAVVSGSITGPGGVQVQLTNCDSADTNYRYHKQNYQGTITQESTIVRTGGATDGTTPISRKMVTTANSKYFSPLESDPILFWNETTGSNVTVTVPVITDNVTLTDAEAWVEVEYLGTSGFPIASTSSDRSTDILASASNQTTDATSTWTTTGLTTPVQQELSVTFTPQEKGVIRARVMLAKASTTMYFDPEILTTSGRTYMVGADGQVNEGASGSNTIDPLSETIPGL